MLWSFVMGLLDLIKDIPHILTLRDKVRDLETQNAGLDEQIAIIKDDLR